MKQITRDLAVSAYSLAIRAMDGIRQFTRQQKKQIVAKHHRLEALARPPVSSLYCAVFESSRRPFRMLLSRPGYQEDGLSQRAGWAKHALQVIYCLIDESRIFLDVGANIGHYTLYISHSFDELECIGFEPHPRVFAELSRNVALNHMKNVTLHNVAVGDQPGDLEFYLSTGPGRGLSSAFQNPDLGVEYKKTVVPCVTLDTFLPDSQRRRVGFIKIDVQGFELQVLRGACRLVQQSRPVVLLEFSPEYLNDPPDNWRGIVECLPAYRLFKLSATEPALFPIEPDCVAQKRGDIVAIPEESTLLLQPTFAASL